MDRKTGVVVPLSALYTKECAAVGDFLALKDFADFCEKCAFSVIQLLPVNDSGTHSSPYSGLSAFALHPLYIRISALPEFDEAYKGNKAFASAYRAFAKEFTYRPRFDYGRVLEEKTKLLHLLYAYIERRITAEAKGKASPAGTNVVSAGGDISFADKFNADIDKFVRGNSWVIHYAVFKNLKDSAMQASWKQWDENLRTLTRKQIELRWDNRALKSSHNFFVWCQLRAAEQFKEAADYVRSKHITLKGDIPILMNEDSADCWAWPEFFNQELRAGAPPDGENPLGQNWGFPTYSWNRIAADQYSWWKNRVMCAANYYDAFRIDHILGFFRIWAVNARESTAYLGHTMPYADFPRKALEAIGFDEGRIHWLTEPHIPTKLIEDITWNHEEALAMLGKVCDRVGGEELWNFKKSVTADGDIYATHFSDDGRKDNAVKQALAAKWRDRALIEIEEGSFIPVYSYNESTAWQSLSWEERQRLKALFDETATKENDLWRRQALDVLTPICTATGMIPCAEDLGVSLDCMPEVLSKLSILSLKVIRWNREWDRDGQPFVPFANFPELSVSTTSVHDSSTLRQWWNGEKQSVEAYLRMCGADGGETPSRDAEFSAEVADFCLRTAARTNSAWLLNPLQDYLFLDQGYYLDTPDEERINVPGSVNSFNWTYRVPVSVEELQKNKALQEKIKAVVAIHDGGRQ